MDILQESTLLPAQVNSVKAQDPEWKVCRTPDRKYADALLSISEDSCAKDEDAYEASFESGWEEAVQGWGRTPPLACLFQSQKKSKKSRLADGDYHCLLCLDVKLQKQAESDHSAQAESDHSAHSVFESERNCTSNKQHLWKGSKSPHLGLKRLSKHPANAAAYPSAVEHRSFKLALCADEASPDASRLTLVETFPDPASMHALDKQCAERGRNVTAIINSFSVLPPVKVEEAGNLGSPTLTKTSGAALNQSTAHRVSEGGGSQDVLGARGQAGVEKICELIKQAGVDSGVPEVRCGPFPPDHHGLPGLHWASQNSKHVQVRFSVGIQNSRNRDPALNLVRDLFPRPEYRLVRNIKYEDLSRVSSKNNHGHRLYIALKSRSISEPSSPLPALLGTRMPLPTSSHRLL